MKKSFLTYLFENNTASTNSNVVKGEIVPVSISNPQKIYEQIVDAFNNIRETYAKCLAVIESLDSQAGALSEKILAYLLTTKGGNKSLSAKQVGSAQSLTDIVIKINDSNTNISLKTTDSTSPIGLGVNQEKFKIILEDTTLEYFQKIYSLINNNSSLQIPISSLDEFKKSIHTILNDSISNTGTAGFGQQLLSHIDDTINKCYGSICAKIDAIVEKLHGTNSSKEVFMWIEKKKKSTTKSLIGLNFHIFNFDEEKLKEFFFNKCYLYITEKGAFGLKHKTAVDKNGSSRSAIVVSADNSAKTLNIMPYFISIANTIPGLNTYKNFSTKSTITLNAKDQKIINGLIDKMNIIPHENITTSYIESIINIYDSLTKPKK